VTVGFWEHDTNKPARDGLKSLAAFFGVSESYILFGSSGKTMETIGGRLKKLRKLKNKTLDDIGHIVDRSGVAVGYWENDVNSPDDLSIETLAAYYGVEKAYIRYGDGGNTVEPVQFGGRKLPIISYVQAGLWTGTGNINSLSDITEWVNADESMSKNAFALRVRGDSMDSRVSGKSIPNDAIVTVETKFDPLNLNGCVVVAMLDGSDEATIKEFQIDSPSKFLVPWNERYDVIKVNGNCRIVGYVKDVIIRLWKAR
jgi:SOS-response transcriptional repressor LexA